ncbi:hypothetical protein C4J92_2846 [Pseudomonas sp. R3-18-08]|nr:hypothetical protein C4J92_2846 [Pseudomonas sp. R3-18-08]
MRSRKDKGLPRFPRQALDIYGAEPGIEQNDNLLKYMIYVQ